MSSWIIKFFKVKQQRRQPRRTTTLASRKHYREHHRAARVLVNERLPELNQAYGFTYHRISIRNQGTRWGSCSKQGNLNFNYRLLFLAPALQDYIMVHELCHLQELNHSKKFWSLVAQTVPSYQLLRKALRTHSLQHK